MSIRELAKVADDDLGAMVPAACIDFGRMLADPKDITIDFADVVRHPDAATVERMLRGLLQNGYQPTMRASPLVGRLRAMKRQLDRGEDTLERKLRYLLWLN
ncbi:MAG: hypothetical protein ABIY55_15555 [Kofleriaceae bacterium]